MPAKSWTTLHHAANLPAEWDELASPYYILQRDFLTMLEEAHPCGQGYHLFYHEGRLDSILVSYQTRMNLGVYTPFEWYVNITILYVALPVACPGMVVGDKTRAQVDAFIRSLRGYCMVPNWRRDESLADMAIGPMNPSVSMQLPWRSFDQYLDSMHGYYRLRCHKALRRGKNLEFEFLQDNSQFDEYLYRYYLYVYEKSQVKLEQLPIAYFQSGIGRILLCKLQGRTIGFIQLFANGKELVGVVIGYDPGLNRELDLYHNLQLQGIKYAIESGFEVTEMGQTAEEMKLKYGGRYTFLNVMLRHSNPLLHAAIRLIMPFTAYKPIPEKFRVFKESTTA